MTTQAGAGNSSMGCWIEEYGTGPLQYQVVDSGAMVSCYPYETLKNKYPDQEIHPSDVVLNSVNNLEIPCYGYVKIFVSDILLYNGERLPITPRIVHYYLIDGLLFPVISDEDIAKFKVMYMLFYKYKSMTYELFKIQ